VDGGNWIHSTIRLKTKMSQIVERSSGIDLIVTIDNSVLLVDIRGKPKIKYPIVEDAKVETLLYDAFTDTIVYKHDYGIYKESLTQPEDEEYVGSVSVYRFTKNYVLSHSVFGRTMSEAVFVAPNEGVMLYIDLDHRVLINSASYSISDELKYVYYEIVTDHIVLIGETGLTKKIQLSPFVPTPQNTTPIESSDSEYMSEETHRRLWVIIGMTIIAVMGVFVAAVAAFYYMGPKQKPGRKKQKMLRQFRQPEMRSNLLDSDSIQEETYNPTITNDTLPL
jgi:hypothetical protein